jgi:hypothetical protein
MRGRVASSASIDRANGRPIGSTHDVLVGEDEGAVFAERPAGLRAELGFAHGRDAMLANDSALIDRLFDHCEKQGHWLCEDGDRLLELIAKVEGG